jgi:uncharacterized protein
MGRFIGSAVGYAFLILGIIGLFLPILQGILFIFVGLIILGRYARWSLWLLNRIKNKHAKSGRVIVVAENWVERIEIKIAHYYKQCLKALC